MTDEAAGHARAAFTSVQARPSAGIISAARQARAITGPLVLPDGGAGITEASTPLRPATPRTRNRPSTTAPLSVPVRAPVGRRRRQRPFLAAFADMIEEAFIAS